ncbi:hypothetical protein P3T42_000471 [Paraburkholderia sp. GAS38]
MDLKQGARIVVSARARLGLLISCVACRAAQ